MYKWVPDLRNNCREYTNLPPNTKPYLVVSKRASMPRTFIKVKVSA